MQDQPTDQPGFLGPPQLIPGAEWPDPRRPMQELFRRLGIMPPSGVYVTPEDRIFIRATSSLFGVVVTVRLRIMQPDGQIVPNTYTLVTGGTRADQFLSFPGYEGFVLSVTANGEGVAARVGQTFVQVGLVRGDATPVEFGFLFISDYLSTNGLIGWPGGQLWQSIEGPGLIRLVSNAAPAAGADISIPVPAGARWRPITMRAVLTTAVAVASRVVHAVLDDGAGNQFFNNPVTSVQLASTAVGYTFSHTGINLPVTDGEEDCPWPAACVLLQGQRIRSLTTALQAADQWSIQQLLVEEWIEE